MFLVASSLSYHVNARRRIAFVALIVAGIFAVVLFLSLAAASAGTNIVNYVSAKCPGIPYGSQSGGPDYIDISIDSALAAVFGYLLYLTVRDLRRKRKSGGGDKEELAEQ